ncbi:hypothetical protein K503DRAFT_722216 [Rhizopogon vinicolor AM-OR11-026]|uniref:G domain-containing protein n=1 Tax=Rhizopogon vinicolor AM-OR11-026 TaxID=1314800 RepID=A0A1B7MTR5_9AGAM|nr:hypothetical protein K503DRAFT_722216 [Rhizopogon vinicolor AM-OR11-026]
MRTKNIVLFGQTGAGKSSVINLMAGEVKAKTSLSTERCTMHWEEHSIAFEGCNYKVFDTIGLEEHQLGIEKCLDAITNARSLVTKLGKEGGIDLLLFCVRSGRFTSIIQKNYRIFYGSLCEMKVPIVLVVTGLEEEENMEDWWTREKHTFDKGGIAVDGHVCITAASHLNERHQELYELSRQLIRKVVREHTDTEDVLTRNTDFRTSMSTRNIVLFGQSGAGKSSVINLMAGKQIAETSCADICTMHWEEHSIAFDGYNYKVFDTIGLGEPQFGIDEYLEAIVNARNLITKLDNEGGIDLLLFCVRAGRITATVQNNYRLFHEFLCEQKVPIVLVLTGLEGEQNMEDWWSFTKGQFDKYKISVDGHACITSANNLDRRSQQLYEESRQLVRTLVREHTYDRPEGEWIGGYGWLWRFIERFNLGKNKDIATVLTRRCGMPREAAVLLAGQIREELARKSST